jgi:hypothetical protein
MTPGTSFGAIAILGWLQTAFHVAIAMAFVVLCFVRARRIGTAGAFLLAAFALVDVLTLMIYRLAMAALSSSRPSSGTFEGVFSALGVMNVFCDLISIGLVFAAFFVLRKPPSSAGLGAG